MKNKRWQNIALGIAFALPVIGVYVGKKLFKRSQKQSTSTLPEVTRIRIPITSLIGIYDEDTSKQPIQAKIVLPEVTEETSEAEPLNLSKATTHYVASTERGKFHLPTCRWAQNIKSDHSLILESREIALERGYTPCGSCNP